MGMNMQSHYIFIESEVREWGNHDAKWASLLSELLGSSSSNFLIYYFLERV